MRYIVCVIPEEHSNAMNRVFNVHFNDEGDNLRIPLSSDGSLPATHYTGGWYDNFSGADPEILKTELPTPPDNDWSNVGITEQEALDACEALYINIVNGPDEQTNLPEVNLIAVETALSLTLIE